MKKCLISTFGMLVSSVLLGGHFPDLDAWPDVAEKLDKVMVSDNIVVEDMSSEFDVGSTQVTFVTSPECGVVVFCASGENDRQSMMFYTSFNQVTKQWTPPLPINNNFNLLGQQYSRAITRYRKEYFVTKGHADLNVYVIKYAHSAWSKPRKLNSNINTNANESNACLSYDGLTLYFVSDRKGGVGGQDIYASERLTDGSWSAAYNLGPEINTAEDEDSPYILYDGVTLYFSSKGHQTLGGYDVFTATQVQGNWGPAENIGDPINTIHDDLFFVLGASEKYAYYSSSDAGDDKFRIYKITYK